jgi:hypothetical protein
MINPSASAGTAARPSGQQEAGSPEARPVPHVLGFTKLYLRQFGGALPTWNLNLYRTLARRYRGHGVDRAFAILHNGLAIGALTQ